MSNAGNLIMFSRPPLDGKKVFMSIIVIYNQWNRVRRRVKKLNFWLTVYKVTCWERALKL